MEIWESLKQRNVAASKLSQDPSTYPLAVSLHIAALEGTAECVSVEFLKQSAATTKEDILSTPAFITQLLKNLQET